MIYNFYVAVLFEGESGQVAISKFSLALNAKTIHYGEMVGDLPCDDPGNRECESKTVRMIEEFNHDVQKQLVELRQKLEQQLAGVAEIQLSDSAQRQFSKTLSIVLRSLHAKINSTEDGKIIIVAKERLGNK